MIIILAIMMICDIVTGVVKSCKNGDYTSKEFKWGFIRKLLYVVIVVVAISLDMLIHIEIGGNEYYVTNVSILGLTFAEITSILENIGQIGVNVPTVIIKSLKKLADQRGDNDEDN